MSERREGERALYVSNGHGSRSSVTASELKGCKWAGYRFCEISDVSADGRGYRATRL